MNDEELVNTSTAQQLLRLAAQGLWMFDDPPTREAAGGVILATPCQEGLALLLEFELAAIVPDCEGVIHLPAILVEGEHLEVP